MVISVSGLVVLLNFVNWRTLFLNPVTDLNGSSLLLNLMNRPKTLFCGDVRIIKSSFPLNHWVYGWDLNGLVKSTICFLNCFIISLLGLLLYDANLLWPVFFTYHSLPKLELLTYVGSLFKIQSRFEITVRRWMSHGMIQTGQSQRLYESVIWSVTLHSSQSSSLLLAQHSWSMSLFSPSS